MTDSKSTAAERYQANERNVKETAMPCGPPSYEPAERPPVDSAPGKRQAPSPDSEAMVKVAESTAPKGQQLYEDVGGSLGPQTSELGSRSHVEKYTSSNFKGAGYGKSNPYVTEKGEEPYIH